MKWAPWKVVEARSREIEREGNALAARGAPFPMDPDALENAFLDELDAFLDASAAALQCSRSEVEKGAASGALQWKHDYGIGYFVRQESGIPCAINYNPHAKKPSP